MARNVITLFREWAPGRGRQLDSSGNPKQGKTKVVGHINVSSYAGGGGESLAPKDVGLSTIDTIRLRPQNEVQGADAKHTRKAVYAADSNTFYLINVDDAGAVTHLTATSTQTVEFEAVGDTVFDAELL